jgi:small-conductance mechanosensitive channel
MISYFRRFTLNVLTLCVAANVCSAQFSPDSSRPRPAYVVFSGDTLFPIHARLGPFSAEERAIAIEQRLDLILQQNLNPDSLRVKEEQGYSHIILGAIEIMAVTGDDAVAQGQKRSLVAKEYLARLHTAISAGEQSHSTKNLLVRLGLLVALFIGAFFALWAMRKFFPRAYDKLEKWEGTVIRPVRIRSYRIAEPGTVSAILIVLLKGIRLVLTLVLFYYAITYLFSVIPFTRQWDVAPVLIGLLLTIFATAAAIVLFNALVKGFSALIGRLDRWKGTFIKPVKLKTLEIFSEQRIVGILKGLFKLLRTVAVLTLVYFYITIVFSFFAFTNTWAGTLVDYIVQPLWGVVRAFVQFLPNLFFILVVAFVTRYVIRFIRLIFDEVHRGTISFPGFYVDWAQPTFKIVRFLILAFAAIVIFPYLPGASSPVFQGISVFLGVLFSLGSTGAVANIVAGVVLTYMRPFRIGDRVKIAETVGDVIEKTLLVTRVRTIKNVDITVPNAMVLGSHIINYSSVAKERGLILHTSVSIGYAVPWNRVHELLIAAALATDDILKEPKPFVLQTSLDDFFVNYEINAYTEKPNAMVTLYSDLHRHIQDKFNEAGVEIMSPHFSAVRDGNQAAIPDTYLSKSYQAPAFRIFSPGDWFRKPSREEGEQ